MIEYVGAIHLHSVFSDGTGNADEIAKIGGEVGLDFLILTDHNTLRAKQEGLEKFYGNTLLIVGCEINDNKNLNHYLAFGIDKLPPRRISTQAYIDFVNEQGGIGFIAHPHEKRNSMPEHPPYPWTEWDAKNFTGIEIWNHMSEWMENLTEENKYISFIHPLSTITSPQEVTLKVWDELNVDAKVVAIGGVDAHAHKINLLGFFEVEVFPYKVLFKSIRTHILVDKKITTANDSDNILQSKKIFLEALKEGRCFVANYYRGDARGFRFFAESGNQIFQMGAKIELKELVKLRVILPGPSAEIRLLCDGQIKDSLIGHDAEFMIKSKGNYRVEIYLDNHAWIFSNHIKII